VITAFSWHACRVNAVSPAVSGLPFVDELRVEVAAPVLSVWRALAVQLARSRGAPVLAPLLGTHPRRAAGRLFAAGSAVPGFRVTESVAGRRVELLGRHRFSRYALVFSFDEQPDGTVLSARTYAEFPGLHGAAYRRLVISSGAHRRVTLGLLRSVARRAESRQPPPEPDAG
jgi:hypothetical protein